MVITVSNLLTMYVLTSNQEEADIRMLLKTTWLQSASSMTRVYHLLRPKSKDKKPTLLGEALKLL